MTLYDHNGKEIVPKDKKEFSMDSIAASPSGGWANFFNNFGLETDPTFNTIYLPPLEFTYRELTDLYQNPLVFRAINLYSGDGTRKGFDLVSKDDNEKAADIKKEMDKRFKWLAVGAKMIAMWKLYSGGVIFVDVDDGRDPEEPLNENAVRKVFSFQPVDRFNAVPISVRPILRDEKPGQPMHYRIQIQSFRGAESFLCHESRLIRFPSFEADSVISNSERARRLTWEVPAVQRTYDGVKRYGIGVQSSSQLLEGFIEDVFKVANLGDFKDPADLQKYIRAVRLLRNSLKATVIGENDDLSKIATPAQGVKEINQDLRRDTGMIWEIPVPILFSEESGELGGSTLSESRKVWADSVRSNQNNKYTSMFRRMLEIVSYETGWDIEEIDFKWHNILEPTEEEEVDMRNKQADTDYKYWQMGLPEKNVFDVRFANEKTNLDGVDYDPEEFEKIQKEQEQKELEESEAMYEALKNKDSQTNEPGKKEDAA